MILRREARRREGNHVVRRIDAEHRAARHSSGDFRGDLPVAAADVEHALIAGELQLPKLLLGHRLLERGLPVVVAGVPFGHLKLSDR